MGDVQPDSVDPVSTLDTDPVQAIAEDLLAKPKKKRLLSEKQREALKRGREIRWMKRNPSEITSDAPPSLATEKEQQPQIPEVYDTRLQALLNPNTSSSESEHSDDSESSNDSTSRKHKAKKLKKSIPKAVRRRLDKYLKMKMQDVKFLSQQERENRLENEEYVPQPPVLQRENAVYRRPPFNCAVHFA